MEHSRALNVGLLPCTASAAKMCVVAVNTKGRGGALWCDTACGPHLHTDGTLLLAMRCRQVLTQRRRRRERAGPGRITHAARARRHRRQAPVQRLCAGSLTGAALIQVYQHTTRPPAETAAAAAAGSVI